MTTPIAYGLIAGLVFGAIAVTSMMPLTFPDKRAALAAAFVDRFAIGFVIGVANLTWPRWVVGVFVGLLLSAPSAIITKAWRPILIIGMVGGVIIAVLEPRFVH
jgi:hypothetical protein